MEQTKSSLILGGTKGLGRSLAAHALQKIPGMAVVIVGRSVDEARVDAALQGATSRRADLSRETDAWDALAYTDTFDYVFWVAGLFMRKPFGAFSEHELKLMVETNILGPWNLLSEWHALVTRNQERRNEDGIPRKPYHLVVVASTSAWRMRQNEVVYAALKSAQAAFARQFARELGEELPGSKVTLVNPGGMKNPNFWRSTDQDISRFLDPDEVARIIWEQVLGQEKLFDEVQILRGDDGSPVVRHGAELPEIPF